MSTPRPTSITHALVGKRIDTTDWDPGWLQATARMDQSQRVVELWTHGDKNLLFAEWFVVVERGSAGKQTGACDVECVSRAYAVAAELFARLAP